MTRQEGVSASGFSLPPRATLRFFLSLLVFSRSFRSILSKTVTMETTQSLHLCATTPQPPRILGRLSENQTQPYCRSCSWREHISSLSTCGSSRTAPSFPAGSVHTSTCTSTCSYECLQVRVQTQVQTQVLARRTR